MEAKNIHKKTYYNILVHVMMKLRSPVMCSLQAGDPGRSMT